MKIQFKPVILIALFLFGPILMASTLVVSDHCQAPDSSEQTLYAEEFRGSFTLKTLMEKEEEVYLSGKRLKGRAYLKDGQLYLTHSYRNMPVYIPESFVKSIVAQVEKAFALDYVDALIFPDMGHSHMFIDLKYFNEEVDPIPGKNRHLAYEKMLAHPKTKFLYHTAEKLQFYDESDEFLPGRKLGWRFQTRNIVGDSLGNIEIIKKHDHTHNTAHHGDFYDAVNTKSWSAGFNISGSYKGCFAYKRDGKTRYFDISLQDLPYESFGDVWQFRRPAIVE